MGEQSNRTTLEPIDRFLVAFLDGVATRNIIHSGLTIKVGGSPCVEHPFDCSHEYPYCHLLWRRDPSHLWRCNGIDRGIPKYCIPATRQMVGEARL